ncbi:MAG: GNAT family N-acetyltransferase [Actinomycetota bacterium]|nr:GNAT family N-acetyltransferase [Actinomycetota bacterium]
MTLRPSREADVEELVALLAAPEVAEWWGTNDAADVRAELHLGWTVLLEERVAGWLLVHEELEPDYKHVALDIALDRALHGQGYATEALRVVIRHLIARGHHRFTIDPTVSNTRAVRAYSAVGFRPVGVLRAAERGPDGTWRDGLLMDLLAPELR